MTAAVICLAMAVYFEARSEPLAGQAMVAFTVLNRVDLDDYPTDICSVVQQGPRHDSGQMVKDRCQFSFWCDGQPELVEDWKAWHKAIKVARLSLIQPFDLSEGTTHYHANSIEPDWLDLVEPTVAIGGHKFYRLKSAENGNSADRN